VSAQADRSSEVEGTVGTLRRHRRLLLVLTPLLLGALAALAITTTGGASSPIRHVVVLLQENHSFDNVLGQLCIQDRRECAAVSSARNLAGETIPLSRASDFVVNVNHSQKAQLTAMDGGRMDGWEQVVGCRLDQCYTQYDPTQIPSLAALARGGAISDAFFSRDIVPSWGGHVDFFAQTLDGFIGENPGHLLTAPHEGPGWGCDSNLDTPWIDPGTQQRLPEPSCIPEQNGRGPYRTSPVKYVPTFGDRLDAAGKTWGIFGAINPFRRGGTYKWSICPSFAECLYGPQRADMHDESTFLGDARAGALPAFSIVIPASGASGPTSQHNGTSMLVGDNQIGREVSAIERGPDGASTTIFILYDDCGCFYDHARPPAGLGIRLPLVIVSPYAKPGYTDHHVATSSSILAYAESVLGVSPVTEEDANAYDFHESFNYSLVTPSRFAFHAAYVSSSSRRLHPRPDAT
jgi:phospholipase C